MYQMDDELAVLPIEAHKNIGFPEGFANTLLQTDLDSKQQQLDKFQEFLDTYHFSDMQNLADF